MRYLKLFSFLLLTISLSFISMGAAQAAITVEGPFTDTEVDPIGWTVLGLI